MPPRVIAGIEKLKSFVGQEVGVTDWVQVSQSQIDRFADLTDDHQWIHVDAKRAATESPYRKTVAHGFLTLSLVSALSRDAVTLEGDFQRKINYGLNRVRFPAPVPAGSRIRGRFKLQKLEEVSGGTQITWEVTVESEGSEKPCLVAEWLLRFYR